MPENPPKTPLPALIDQVAHLILLSQQLLTNCY
jgi:hypothetical protein